MKEEEKSTFNLDSFKKAKERMIATNSRAYDNFFNSGRKRLERTRDYSLEEIERIINSGSMVEQQRLSRNYFNKNGFYKRIIVYYSSLLKYTGLLIPNPSYGKKLSTEHISKRYYNAMNFIERMSLPTMLTNCALRALIDGSYYGIIQTLDKENFVLLDLPGQYCCSRFKDFKGNDIIEFDITYFDTILDEDSREEALATYPKEVSRAYRKFKNGKTTKKWVFIPSDIGICFPLFDGRPLFLNIIPACINYEESVEIERERDLDEIRKILVQKIPHLTTGELLFEPDEAEEIHSASVGMMNGNKNISVLTTYADVDAIVSKTSADANSNNLEKMSQNIYNEAGTTSQLFAATGNLALSTSLKNDLSLMMILANKFSVFITNIVNDLYANTNINFKYKILPITYYNDEDYINNTFKLASSGYSFILPALASGLSQRDLVNIKDLENDLLGLREKLLPLSSSYTQSSVTESDGEPGALEKTDTQKNPKTIQNEESLDKQGGSTNG